MPSLSINVVLVELRFKAFNLQLQPLVKSQAPAGLGFRVSERLAASSASRPNPLFRPASNSAEDVAEQRRMDVLYSSFIQSMSDAIEFGHNMWRLQAHFSNVVINGPVAMGGQLDGPDLGPLIANAPMIASDTTSLAPVSKAIAAGLNTAWGNFEGTISVPGLPWYPAFAAFPGPSAPPMPNVPTPFAALTQNAAALTSDSLKSSMSRELKGRVLFSDQLFASFASALEQAFFAWRVSQKVMLVMGSGPVPSFAPPYVPVGPVVGGTIIAAPGHLMS